MRVVRAGAGCWCRTRAMTAAPSRLGAVDADDRPSATRTGVLSMCECAVCRGVGDWVCGTGSGGRAESAEPEAAVEDRASSSTGQVCVSTDAVWPVR